MRGCQNKQFAFFHLNIPVHCILVILVENVYYGFISTQLHFACYNKGKPNKSNSKNILEMYPYSFGIKEFDAIII